MKTDVRWDLKDKDVIVWAIVLSKEVFFNKILGLFLYIFRTFYIPIQMKNIQFKLFILKKS